MSILFISSSIESLGDFEAFKKNSEIEIEFATKNTVNRENKVNFVFYDQNLGQESIYSLISLYQKQKPQWLVFNLENNIQQSLQYLKAGAAGIVFELASNRKLQDIISILKTKQIYLEPELSQALALRQIKKSLIPFDLLSSREFDVFCLLAENYSIQTIAEILLLSAKTVFNCQAHIRKKLKLKNQQKILDFAKTHGLITSKSL